MRRQVSAVKQKDFETEEEALADAKDTLEFLYGGIKRSWLEAHPTDSYNNPNYRVAVYALEGSPPKGVILLNRSLGFLAGYEVMGKVVLKYHFPIKM
jgi:hypothetical protein